MPKEQKKPKWKHYYVCKGSRSGEKNCGKIFYNDDDNVCVYCGSKNTRQVLVETTRLFKDF